MNKKGIILLVLMMVAGASVFASGQMDDSSAVQDDTRQGYGFRSDDRDAGRFGGKGDSRFEDRAGGRLGPAAAEDCDCLEEDMEEVALTGTVDFNSKGTILTADGEEYTLLYPHRAIDLDIEDGTEISVTGWEVEDPRFSDEEDSEVSFFHVLSAEIDGETYELEGFGPYDGRMGGGRPMGGSRGRGFRG